MTMTSPHPSRCDVNETVGGMASTNLDSTKSGKAPSPAVDRALTVLETLVAAESPMTLTALAKETGIPLATCGAITQTLEQRGYATRRVIGRSHFWRATLRLNALAAQLVRRIDLSKLVEPFLRRLVDEVDLPAHAGVLDGQSVVYLAKVAAPGIVQFDTHPGKVSPFNLTALGRAVAAYLPERELAVLMNDLPQGSGPKAGPSTPDALRDKLAEVSKRGYAFEDEEEEPGISCVAAAFFDADDRVVGSIGVTGFARDLRTQTVRRIADAVVSQANQISKELVSGSVGYP